MKRTYCIKANFGYGEEIICYCDNRQQAKENLKDYRKNDKNYYYRISYVLEKE